MPRTKFLDQVRGIAQVRHMSRRTAQAYVYWIKRFILFHNKTHPSNLGSKEISAFLSHLAVDQRVAASTQNQALNALVFLYRHVLKREPGNFSQFVRAKRPEHVPVVLTREEVQRVLAQLEGVYWLMAGLLYGAGLRLLECLRLSQVACRDLQIATIMTVRFRANGLAFSRGAPFAPAAATPC